MLSGTLICHYGQLAFFLRPRVISGIRPETAFALLFESFRSIRTGVSCAGLSSGADRAAGFDLLSFLIQNRERVVSKDELLAEIWLGRIVSESALTTRINAARSAIGD
jgi:hypothetical protein